MKLQDKIIGILGIVLFLFSIVYYTIQNIWDVINWITLVLWVLSELRFSYLSITGIVRRRFQQEICNMVQMP